MLPDISRVWKKIQETWLRWFILMYGTRILAESCWEEKILR